MKSKFIAILCIILSGSAWASNTKDTDLEGCGELKKLPKVKQAAESAQAALDQIDKAKEAVAKYKTTCQMPASQNNDRSVAIGREGQAAETASGEANQKTENARKALEAAAGPLDKLEVRKCVVALDKARAAVDQAHVELRIASRGMDTCGQPENAMPASANNAAQSQTNSAVKPNYTGGISPTNQAEQTLDHYDARWCGLGGCVQGPDKLWRHKYR